MKQFPRVAFLYRNLWFMLPKENQKPIDGLDVADTKMEQDADDVSENDIYSNIFEVSSQIYDKINMIT